MESWYWIVKKVSFIQICNSVTKVFNVQKKYMSHASKVYYHSYAYGCASFVLLFISSQLTSATFLFYLILSLVPRHLFFLIHLYKLFKGRFPLPVYSP